MAFARPTLLRGVSELSHAYDGFIVDLFGVVHNGETAFAGAIDCLAHLIARVKRVVLLSNSPRRKQEVSDHLLGIGISDALYGGLITSGELVFEALSGTEGGGRLQLGRRFYHMGPRVLSKLMAGTGKRAVPAVNCADFVLVTGTLEEQTLAEREALLHACHERRLPMICANPDVEVLIGDRRLECAGAIAARYEAIGGKAWYFGKPHQQAYAKALSVLALPPSSVVCIGDGLNTDVLGANRSGIDAVLVAGGIHKSKLRSHQHADIDWEQLDDLIFLHQAYPRFIINSLSW
ncbi:TIGR01459 family HAD-type hydrolase [Rhizobium azibense]|uniref:HAD superfamily hydrolase (TIGR01459 family) n=1 Tax=Rhizobium azibense TaxID=1136135 RepID=A0A4R3RAY5_9HYPH|nr:TIGR01459 family HAD-type hydrolase [Rhizobium azibense]TCU32573.1 HAD superfamily hydrolase (TIGR01459 family) [Rhizobium azibense]